MKNIFSTFSKFSLIAILIIVTFGSCKGKIEAASIIESTGETHMSTEDFKTKIANEEAQLIDVRTLIEYGQGHIENATLIDYTDTNFINNATKTLDKSKPVYLYCLSGGKRSQNSVKLLTEKGYDVHDLIGGISGWEKKGFKVSK